MCQISCSVKLDNCVISNGVQIRDRATLKDVDLGRNVIIDTDGASRNHALDPGLHQKWAELTLDLQPNSRMSNSSLKSIERRKHSLTLGPEKKLKKLVDHSTIDVQSQARSSHTNFQTPGELDSSSLSSKIRRSASRRSWFSPGAFVVRRVADDTDSLHRHRPSRQYDL